MKNVNDKVTLRSNIIGANILIGSILSFWFIYTFLKDYELFHFSTEAFASIISFCILIITMNIRSFVEDTYMTFLGVVFGFIGITNIIHILSTLGIAIFSAPSLNSSLQIMAAKKIIESISFLLLSIFLHRKLKFKIVFSLYSVLILILFLSIFYWGVFPDCVIDGSRRTLFHITSGWAAAGIILVSLLLLIRNKNKLDDKVFIFIAVSFTGFIISEVLFSIGTDSEYIDKITHFLKAVSFYFIYKSIIESSLRTPYRFMFYELKKANDTLRTKALELESEIIERRKIEEELEHSREFYIALTEGLPGIVWMLGTDMKCSYANRGCVEYVGKPMERLLGKGWTVIIHPEDIDACYKAVADAFDARLPFEVEGRLRRHDGQYKWHSIIGKPVNDNKGVFTGYIGVCYDITERKQKEEVLEKYQLLLEKANDIILFVDSDGNILEANKAAVKAYGYSYRELLTRSVLDFRSPGERHSSQSQLQKASAGGIIFEAVHFKKDGSYFEAEVSAQGAVVGGKEVVISIIRDITSRKKTEQLLRESEFKYRSLFENMNEAIVYGRTVTGDKGEKDSRILEVNSALEKMTGLIAEALIGKSVSEILQDMAATYNKVIFDENGEIYEVKVDWLKKWYRVSAYRLDRGYFVNIISDITEQKLLQERLENSNKELHSTLERLKLTQIQLIQQERLAGIGQLAAGVAHEINNPLGFIMSNHETLKRYLDRIKESTVKYRALKNNLGCIEDEDIKMKVKDINETEKAAKLDFIIGDLKDLVDDTNDGLERIHNIVKGLRTFSRVDQINKLEQYDLNAGIKNTLTVAQNEIKYAAEVELCLSDLPVIYGDGGQINQVLLNIVINAVHAVKSRGLVELGIIKITTSSDAKFVRCEIEDNGTGIPESNMRKLFNPFFTTKPVGQGTGLGLSISYDIIVNKHGGELSIESSEGVGTKVIIKLPLERSN